MLNSHSCSMPSCLVQSSTCSLKTRSEPPEAREQRSNRCLRPAALPARAPVTTPMLDALSLARNKTGAHSCYAAAVPKRPRRDGRVGMSSVGQHRCRTQGSPKEGRHTHRGPAHGCWSPRATPLRVGSGVPRASAKLRPGDESKGSLGESVLPVVPRARTERLPQELRSTLRVSNGPAVTRSQLCKT